MSYTDILKTIPTIQSAGLVSHNLSYLNKKKKSKGLSGMVGLGVTNIVGTSLIQEQAKLL